MSVCFRLYRRIGKERRLTGVVGDNIEDDQAVYRSDRETSDNGCMLRNIIERKMDSGEKLLMTIIDLKPAFDTVYRKRLSDCLEELEVLLKLTEIIGSIYRSVKAEVQVSGTRSGKF